MTTLKLRSPAKLNLFLEVRNKRSDGYHSLWTLFERISLFDEITLKKEGRTIHFKSLSREVPGGRRNLAYRAAALLKESYGVKEGVLITLKKRIPVAAGLGGGSGNAATVLLGLNRLWKLRLSRQKLLKLGATLGSDVPFFLLETPFALGSGRGEILRKASLGRAKLWHCIVKPPFGISTRQAYAAFGTCGLTPQKPDVKMLLHSIRRGRRKHLSQLLVNSLEVALNKRVTQISKIKKELARRGASATLLAGSGSAVFGIFSSRKSAEKAARSLRAGHKRWQIFTASTY